MATVKRDQILQEAEKLAGRGKVDAAIKEYRRALDLVPNDTNTLNRLGDLLVKADRISEAIDVYQKIAEHFSRDGFFLKAIAIYKKVNRLDPQRVEIYEQLADLYFKQGLAVEGRQQLLSLADWFLRSKRPGDAVRVYRRLLDLEPSNFQARAKLVDLFVQLDDKEGVATEISAFGRLLLARGMLDEAVKLYHRAVDLVPERVELVTECVEALVSGGRNAQALELADRAMAGSASPGIELAQAVARARMEAGDLTQARELLERVLPEFGERTAVIQLYGDLMLRVGDVDEAKDRMLPVIGRLAKAGDRARAAALVKRLLRSAPGDLQVLELATKVISRREDPDMASTLEAALADALLREGRRDEAGEVYTRLAQEDPDNRLFRNRLEELGVTPAFRAPEAPPASERVSAPDLKAEPLPTDDPASRGLFPDQPETTPDDGFVEFVDVEIPGEVADEVAQSPGVWGGAPAPAVPFLSSHQPGPAPDDFAGVPEGPITESPAVGNSEELVTEAMVFMKYGLTDKAVSHLLRVLSLSPDHAKAREMLTSLGITPDGGAGESALPEVAATALASLPTDEPAQGPESVASAEFEYTPGDPPLGALPVHDVEAAEPVPPPPAAPPAAARLHRPTTSSSGSFALDELEAMLGVGRSRPKAPAPPPVEIEPVSVDGQLGFDVASVVPVPEAPPEGFSWSVPTGVGDDVSEEGAASPPGDELPREEIPPLEGVQHFEVAEEAVEVLQPAEELLDMGAMLDGPSLEQLGEVDLFLQQGLLDDAAEGLKALQGAFPGHPDVLSRLALLKAKGWEEPAQVTAEVTAEELFTEEEQFFDLAAELERELAEDELVAEATGSTAGAEESIEDLFREFQRGVAEQIGEEDHDTHFNLGLAYREMGLLDEAIGEFQLASKSPALFVECASMIAACYVDRGLPDAAAEWYQRALAAPNVAPEAEVGLKYELARSQEMAGNTSAALGNYAEVLAINPGFRDVVDRVSRLRSN